MGSRFTLFAQDIVQREETSEVSVPIRGVQNVQDLFGMTSLLLD